MMVSSYRWDRKGYNFVFTVFQALCFKLWLDVNQLFANQKAIIITSYFNKNGIFILKNTASDVEYTSRNWRFLNSERLWLWKKYCGQQLMSPLRRGQKTADWVLPCSLNSAEVEMREKAFGEKKLQKSLFWPQSCFPLPGPKLTPPNSGVCPMPMEKAAVPD